MSTSPNSTTTASYLATISNNAGSGSGSAENVTNFQHFFEFWILEQNQHLQDLVSASNNYKSYDPTQSTELSSLIDRVLNHYEKYYDAKSRFVEHNALCLMSPSWLSSFENAFLWIGGWRPSMVFHLLYSKSGLHLEAQLGDLIRRLSTDDLADLSPRQLVLVDELQQRTLKEEKLLTEKMAKDQETVADSSMVELSHVVSELIRNEDTEMSGGREEKRVESSLKEKERRFGEILGKADDLRFRTLKQVVGIFSPIQAAHFLIAAAELHLRLHQWGKEKDASCSLGNSQ